MADDVTATGKYLLISVPEFAKDPVGPRAGQEMTSFLRLGAFHERPEDEDAMKRAWELAKLAEVVSSGQGGHLTSPYGAEIDTTGTGVEGRGVFLDDQRNDDPDYIDPPERLRQSEKLLTRGGWWDHSDGNRISTTYGDKVEVIRGNYKMVVMHRQDDPTGGSGWDVSGGQIQDLGPNSMPGASIRVEFRPGMFGQKGTWHLENITNNFIQTSDYAGDFFEHWYGNLKHSTVGSENPQEWNGDLGKPYGNPHILEKTWASKIESYTGSSGWRIPEIKEETYAKKTSSLTDVSEGTTEVTNIGAGTASTTNIGAGTVESTVIGGGTAETTVVGLGTMAATVVGLGTLEATVVGGAALDATVVGGLKAGVTVVGILAADVAISPLAVDVSIAKVGVGISIGSRIDISTSDAEEFHLGPWLKLTATVDTEMAAIKDEITEMKTQIATNHTDIAGGYDVMALIVNLL